MLVKNGCLKNTCIRIPSARNRCPAFDKDKYLEPMFGDVGHAQQKPCYAELLIGTTSRRTCKKHNVGFCAFNQILLHCPFPKSY